MNSRQTGDVSSKTHNSIKLLSHFAIAFSIAAAGGMSLAFWKFARSEISKKKKSSSSSQKIFFVVVTACRSYRGHLLQRFHARPHV
jgi:hypothetical protein